MDIRTLKTGDEFITLEQFMLLPDSSFYQTDRLWSPFLSGSEWIKRYEIAKESWNKYGKNPPMNVQVAVLVNGHGTTFPSLTNYHFVRFGMGSLPKRKLTQYRDGNEVFFALERKVTDSIGRELKGHKPALSLVDKALWWREIFILD